jgi:hypothetical protein
MVDLLTKFWGIGTELAEGQHLASSILSDLPLGAPAREDGVHVVEIGAEGLQSGEKGNKQEKDSNLELEAAFLRDVLNGLHDLICDAAPSSWIRWLHTVNRYW